MLKESSCEAQANTTSYLTALQAFVLCKVTNSKLAGKTLLTSVFQSYVQAMRLLDKHHLAGLLKA